MQIQIINPLESPTWDETLLSFNDSTIFHTSNWAKVLSETYQYKPCYFIATKNGKMTALLPVMEIKSLLTGKRGVSLPFTDSCEVMGESAEAVGQMIEELRHYGKKKGWRYFELRGRKSILAEKKPHSFYYTHHLQLRSDEQGLFSGFRDSNKRNIKKALKQGVQVRIDRSLDAVKRFYRLNCITRKHHGLPPQPFGFFRKIHEHIMSQNRGFVALATHGEHVIAGAVYFHFRDKAIYKYGASDRHYQNLRANNLVMWEAIKHLFENGFKTLDFGRTEPENEGLLQFKRGWGTSEHVLNYYRYDYAKETFSSDESGPKTSYKVFKAMPVSVLRLLGALAYRHMG